ncbi:MAG: glycine cleavage system protein H [Bacteroidales bacterium]
MNALLSVLGSIGIFLAGLVVRFGILGLVLILLTAVFLAGLGVVRLAALLRRRVLGLGVADGLSWKRGAYYSPGHTWVEPVGARSLRLGFDDLAQRVLGDASRILLPKRGDRLVEGQPFAEVVCGGRRAMIPSPVTGTVTSQNELAALDPTIVHRDPYRRGWLVTVESANSAYTRLRYGTAASRWLREESARLRHAIEQQLQLHAADGGELAGPGATLLDDEQWQALMGEFLRAR